MGKPTGPTNPVLQRLVNDLRKLSSEKKVKIWKRVADDLEMPTRRRREINVGQIALVTNEGDVVVVPGKVLGVGEIKHKVKVAAWRFSESARRKINGMSIYDIMKENPGGKGVRIIG